MESSSSSGTVRDSNSVQTYDFGPLCSHGDHNHDASSDRPQSLAFKMRGVLYYADTAENRKKMEKIRSFVQQREKTSGQAPRNSEKRKLSSSSVSSSFLHPKQGLVERVNKLSSEEFYERYMNDLEDCIIDPGCMEDKVYGVYFQGARIPKSDLDDCFRLIKETSSKAYKESGFGWSPRKKKAEMRLPDMKYLLVKEMVEDGDVENALEQRGFGSNVDADVEGFSSFMITYEDGYEVIYCYEIHLSLHLINKGIGTRLMSIMEEIGTRVGVEKAMLTVFRSNEAALKFYRKLGYVEDEYSPQARLLRNGSVKEPSYVILSKPLPKLKDTSRDGQPGTSSSTPDQRSTSIKKEGD